LSTSAGVLTPCSLRARAWKTWGAPAEELVRGGGEALGAAAMGRMKRGGEERGVYKEATGRREEERRG
jgi:hypothetical protein